MKKQNTALLVTSIFIAVMLSFSACSNVYSPSVAGEGNVTVSLSAGPSGRTLMPSALDFDRYEFTFKNGSNEYPFTVENGEGAIAGSFTFSVPVGSGYTLNVKAYKGTGEGKMLAAEGNSESFSVNGATSVTVKLTGNISDGETGTFSYYIQYPSNSWIERFVLVGPVGEIDLLSTEIQEGSPNVMMASVGVTAGWYGLELDLKDADGKLAYVDDMAVIYSDTTTFFGTAVSPVIISSAKFKDSPVVPGDGGERVWDWHGFDVEGASHWGDNDTSRGDFNPSGNYPYDRGRAVGTRYNSFTDAKGDTWTDVLKLEPPAETSANLYKYYDSGLAGYQPWTMIMTRPAAEAGSYRLSMQVWVENSDEAANIVWHNTKTWGSIEKSVPQREVWFTVEGTLSLGANDELGILARGDGIHNGLRSATIYIKDLQLSYEGEIIVDTNKDVKVTPDNLTLAIGTSRKLTANREVTWSCGDSLVATVDADGLVTAVGLGTAVITAASKEDSTKSATVTVNVVAELPKKHIAISFDDGPNSHFTPLFMDIFESKRANATFFCTGGNVDGNQELALNMVERGFEIGSHSYTHTTPSYLDDNEYNYAVLRNELIRTQIAIENATGKPATVFRAPTLTYENVLNSTGSNNEWQYNGVLERACASMGLALIDATGHQRGNYDWDGNFNADAIFERAISLAKDGGILLLHDSSDRTLEALPRILDWLKSENYEVHSVAEMTALKNIPSLIPGRIYYDFNDSAGIPNFQGPVVPVDEITITPSGGIVLSEEVNTITLSAAISPSNASLTNVYWYSDNDAVAAVDANGVVTAAGYGTAVIRAAAGTAVAKVTVTVDLPYIPPDPPDPPDPIEVDTINKWEDTDDFKLAGSTGSGYGTPSGAVSEVVSFDGFNNVLKLVPPAGGYPCDTNSGSNPLGGGCMVLTYRIPHTGTYTFSMEVFMAEGADDVNLFIYNCYGAWPVLNQKQYGWSYTGEWETVEFTAELKAGDVIGILGSNGSVGLRNATIYVKDFLLELDAADNPVIDIPGIAAPYDPVIKLAWDDDGKLITAGPVTVKKDGTVTIKAPDDLGMYMWWVDREAPVIGGPTFIFDTIGRVTGETYTVALWTGTESGGDAVKITVTK